MTRVYVEHAPEGTLCASRGAADGGTCGVFADYRVLIDGETWGDACSPHLADTVTGALGG